MLVKYVGLHMNSILPTSEPQAEDFPADLFAKPARMLVYVRLAASSLRFANSADETCKKDRHLASALSTWI